MQGGISLQNAPKGLDMAIYRNIQMAFWTDTKISDDYTPEDRYFYLYLMTNPHTNLCGCYEISVKQMADETGYSKETIEKLIKRFEEVHKSIVYSKATKEVLLINWSKYNWTSSEKFRKPLLKEIEQVKNIEFKSFLEDLFSGEDTVSIPYSYGSDTTVTVTDTVTVSDTVSVSDSVTVRSEKKRKYFEDEKLQRTFDDYVEMRKKLKKPMTERAKELAIKKLVGFARIPDTDVIDTDMAISILEQSIMNSWQGLFPLKGAVNEKQNKSIADTWRDL